MIVSLLKKSCVKLRLHRQHLPHWIPLHQRQDLALTHSRPMHLLPTMLAQMRLNQCLRQRPSARGHWTVVLGELCCPMRKASTRSPQRSGKCGKMVKRTKCSNCLPIVAMMLIPSSNDLASRRIKKKSLKLVSFSLSKPKKKWPRNQRDFVAYRKVKSTIF